MHWNPVIFHIQTHVNLSLVNIHKDLSNLGTSVITQFMLKSILIPDSSSDEFVNFLQGYGNGSIKDFNINT